VPGKSGRYEKSGYHRVGRGDTMNQPVDSTRVATGSESERAAKKSYHKPQFRFERVFETRALTCGKVQTTQASCAHNRKNS